MGSGRELNSRIVNKGRNYKETINYCDLFISIALSFQKIGLWKDVIVGREIRKLIFSVS